MKKIRTDLWAAPGSPHPPPFPTKQLQISTHKEKSGLKSRFHSTMIQLNAIYWAEFST